MKGVDHYQRSYTLSFLLVLILLDPTVSTNVNTLSTTTESLTISSNRTLVSPGGVFELGFFKPSGLSRWYLGIWYKKVPKKTYAWVANRDNPLPSSTGTLRISGNNLVLLVGESKSNNSVWWSTNLTVSSPVVAELLANGNLVMRFAKINKDSPNGFLWQSFDFPTDTLLPGMKLSYDRKTGRNRFLTSWRSLDDPSSGYYTYKVHIDIQRGLPEYLLMKKDSEIQRSGRIIFRGIPEGQGVDYNYTDNSEEVAYTFLNANSRLTVEESGSLDQFTWIPPSWIRSDLGDACSSYDACGPNAYCGAVTSLISSQCICLEGFYLPYQEDQLSWELSLPLYGCVRRTPLSCSGNQFSLLENVKLPDTETAAVYWGIDFNECEQRCFRSCKCTSFAYADVRNGGMGCVIWTGDLIDIRTYSIGGHHLYLRVAPPDAVLPSDKENDRNRKIIGWSIGVGLMLILSVVVFRFWKRRQKQAKAGATPTVHKQVLMNGVVLPRHKNLSDENDVEDLELPLMEFEAVLTATEHFSDRNKVGEGGFGPVYKGRLLDGQEIAVKRLSEMSAQGTNEFKNEARLIARLQHINLVRLLGCCVDEGEKILIYEYLENLSLDSHLFDERRSCMLNWKMRFDIINGIARGLLYLHQDSSIRIIHRDLKASNILIDKDMTPKISDFGMARIFGRDETEANTRKVVGTYGYISPEYAIEGIFSMKSDVYSFGVLLLEIISGKRNRGFHNSGRDRNLLECVWRNWTEGRGLEIADTVIIDPSSPTFRPREILRCLQIGLLCVQARPEDRPLMAATVLMLGSEAADVPQPKPPGYCVIGNNPEHNDHESCTVNQFTMSVIDGR